MKIDFYLRVFFTFLLFSSIITYLNFDSTNQEKIKIKQNNEWNLVFSRLEDKKELVKNSLKLIDIKFEYLQKTKAITNIKLEDFDNSLVNKVKHYSLKKDLIEIKKKPYYFQLDENHLKKNRLYKIDKNKNLFIIYRINNELLELSFDISNLFKINRKINGIYNVFNKNEQYLFDIKNINDINKLNPNSDIQTQFAKFYNSIIKNENFVSENLSSKKLKINNDISFIVVSTFDENYMEKDINFYISEDLIFVIFINLILSFLLSLVFSNPMKTILKRVSSNSSNMKDKAYDYKELNESLEIIDENVMIIKTSIDGEIIDISKALCDFTKYVKNELIGHHYSKLLNTTYSKEYLEKIWKDIRSQKIKKFEINGLSKNGDEFYLEVFSQELKNNFDEIIGFTFICENITQKKKIEFLYKDLDYQLEQYNSIFKHVSSGIAIISLNGEFLKFNNAFIDFFKYSEDELKNDVEFKDLLDDEASKVELLLEEIKDFKNLPNIEKVYVDATGMKIHLDTTLSILPDNKSLVLIVNSLEDKRKQQEINQILERKIHEELAKSRKKDEIHKQEQIKNAKLTSIGSLAAGITHEINTPLTYIKGNFEMMGYDIDELPNSEIKTRMIEDKVKIEEGLNRIANIVESMREISQKSSEANEVTNIYSTLITVLTMAYNRSKQITPIYLNNELFEIGELDKNKYEFLSKVQKQRIEQVWIIIVNNALDELVNIDSYENRKLYIDILKDDNNIIVKFKDNAGGVPQDVIPVIFDPFVSTKEHGGMGVGLNIAKNIIDQQNGKIRVYNEENGAVFEVTLELYKQEDID